MTGRIPWKAVAAVLGSVLLVIIAFRSPTGAETPSSSEDTTAISRADGAAVLQAGPSVTTPAEQQPAVDIPQPVPGAKPTQVVVVSIDGGCETSDGTIRQFMDVGAQARARFTFFLSGLCLLPDSRRMEYRPPGKLPGQSDVPFADPAMVSERISVFSDMYRSGHEIGTHFLGHFCSPGGVDEWTEEQWREEIAQARTLLDNWAVNNPQAAGTAPLPFDSAVFEGDRTPCLLGQRKEMWPAFASEGFRYEASDPGVLQWPRKTEVGIFWNFPLPALKLSGTDNWVLSMDYNLLVNQNDGETEGDQATCDRVEQQTYDTYMDALRGVYDGNRAPLVVGSHLNDWLCGAYIDATKRFIADAAAQYPDVKFVSFADLADWLDAMDPATLAELQALPPQRY